MTALVDSHCHLDFPNLIGEVDEVVARAVAAGVTRMVTICTKLRTEPDVRALAEAHTVQNNLGTEQYETKHFTLTLSALILKDILRN